MTYRSSSFPRFDWLPPAPTRLLPEGEHQDPKPDPTEAKVDPEGFPANTPPSEMTSPQQVAYWQNQARRNERIAKERADYDDLKAKAAEFDAAQAANATEQEKALKAAREEASAEVTSKFRGRIAKQQFRVAAAGRIADGVLNDYLDDVDFSKFIKDDGEPDEERIAKAVARLAPEKKEREWPKGSRAGGSREEAPKSGVAVGRDRFTARRGRSTP